MKIEFDAGKSERNTRERGLSFWRAMEFDFETAAFIRDNRRDYGEARVIAVGYLASRLHVLCFTTIEDGIRVISFRKANAREGRKYGKPLTTD
jgi:uncharacterized DUF497 family protein